MSLRALYSKHSDRRRYLLLAYRDSIRIYARSTSLLVRSLNIKTTSKLSSFRVSRHEPAQLYICFSDGRVQLWDWQDATLIQSWDIKSQIIDSECCELRDPSPADVLLTIDQSSDGHRITAHQLQGMKDVEFSIQKTLYRLDRPINKICVVDGARFIIASGYKWMVVGARRNTTSKLKVLDYKWWEFSTPIDITAIDAKVRQGQDPDRKELLHQLDMVIGCGDGTIHYYLDVATQLAQIERSRRVREPPNTIKHWHRDAVGSVKWSKDGNYLISGGAETTLVLWQLDTGARNFLPHLSSPIDSIVVSPSGTSYAVRLADNSCLVISTQELKPATHVPGVLLPSQAVLDPAKTVPLNARWPRRQLHRRSAVAISKSSPPQILLAVPNSSSFDRCPEPSQSASHVQTSDVRSGVQVARQALTRTKITDRNIGPDGLVLDEPDVALLQVSHNGAWLATVEEWYPPKRDLDPIEVNEDVGTSLSSRLETCLRFWTRSDTALQWELVTRMDQPHGARYLSNNSQAAVLDLIAHPSATAFITFGNDFVVRIWKPKPRYRDNIPVKDVKGRSLMTWSCRQMYHLPSSSPICQTPTEVSSKLALSQDGSILVVGSSELDAAIYTINLQSMQLLSMRIDMFTGILRDIAVVGQSLVMLADQLLVWDLADDRLHWTLDLDDTLLTNGLPALSLLAVNDADSTFAVAVPGQKSGKRSGARLAIFSPSKFGPSLVHETQYPAVALIPAFQQAGFYAVDAVARIHSLLQSPMGEPRDQEAKAEDAISIEPAATRGIEAVYGNTLTKTQARGNESKRQVTDPNRDVRVIRQHQISELFDYAQPFALPPVTSLFEQVAGIVLGVSGV